MIFILVDVLYKIVYDHGIPRGAWNMYIGNTRMCAVFFSNKFIVLVGENAPKV